MLETPIVNEILTFGAWICNRKQCLLQIPMLFLFAYFYPEQVIEHFKKSEDAPDFKDIDYGSTMTKIKIAGIMNLHMLMGVAVFVILIILPLKYITNRSRPTRLPAVKRYLNMRKREKN